MPVNVSVELGGVLKALPRISAAVEREVLKGLDEIAGVVANSAKAGHPKVPDYIQGVRADDFRMSNWSGSGFGGTLRWLTRTGVTRNSIIPIPAEKKAGVMEARVVSGVEHSNKLEFGDVNRRAFPFMRPALESNRRWAMYRLELAVRTGLQGGGGFRPQGFGENG